jgi:hypothetical protein
MGQRRGDSVSVRAASRGGLYFGFFFDLLTQGTYLQIGMYD